ncbi:MAG: hypothetical protein P8186_25070, partial [Anaerolineae bacterium]
GAHFVLHIVVAQAGRCILPAPAPGLPSLCRADMCRQDGQAPGPGDPEAQRRDRWHPDGHRRSASVLNHAEWLRGDASRPVGGGDGCVSRLPACMQWQIDVEFNSR